MNVRRIPGTAVESSLRLVRLPLDTAVGRLPGNGTGARPTARLALDRADAAVRAFAGTILGDSVLREDAKMRRVALEPREQGQALRGEAEKKTEQADARLEQRQDQVARQRAQTELRAKSRRDEADRARTRRRAAPNKSSARAWQPAARRPIVLSRQSASVRRGQGWKPSTPRPTRFVRRKKHWQPTTRPAGCAKPPAAQRPNAKLTKTRERYLIPGSRILAPAGFTRNHSELKGRL